jgi:predicted DNA-binding ribbon-helix-helix protein
VTPRANVKRSFTIAGHRTSVAMEPEFWEVLERKAASQNMTLPKLIGTIDAKRPAHQPLSSALRVAALRNVQRADA